MAGLHQRPCTLPSIQNDAWGNAFTASKCPDLVVACLAKELCRNTHLLLLSLLQNTQAVTIAEFADTAAALHLPLQAVVRGGQVYMHDKWRIRYSDMSAPIREHISQIPDGTCVNKQFRANYNPTLVHDLLLTLAGPARSAGIRALHSSHWKDHPRAAPRDLACASQRNQMYHIPQIASRQQ